MPKKPAIRVLVHAGFHKTGTSGLQTALRQNAKHLGPGIEVFLKPQMKPLCEAARGYSVSQNPIDLGLVKYEAALFADRLEAPINILSSEDLCGHMPGRLGIDGYDATPQILSALCAAFQAVNTSAEVIVFLTTRDAQAWLHSTYAQNTRASRQILERTEYVTRYADAADLAQAVANVAKAVRPVPVKHVRVDEFWDKPLGLLTPMLKALDLPTAGLSDPTPSNRALPEAILNKMLELNRSHLDDAALRDAKRALL